MTVAVMGAGLSGLACALTLQKHGLPADVYERRSKFGDRFVNGEVLLDIFVRPASDCIESLAGDYGIRLTPASRIRRMTLYSKHEKAVIEGPIGYTNIRGREQDSFEAQLGRMLHADVRFGSDKSYEQLSDEYTHVVVATGDGADAKLRGNYREDLTVSLRGATVEGEFDRESVIAWLDYDLAPFGYGFLIPFSTKEATVVVAIPEIPANERTSTDKLWPSFYDRVEDDTGCSLRVTDEFQVSGYSMGICQAGRTGGSYFVGNAFGCMMPFMGFGQYPSLLTGVYAAYDLLGRGNYEQLTAPLRKSYANSLILRRAMEQLDNGDLDRIVRLLNGPLGERLFLTKRLDPLKYASWLIRPYLMIRQGASK